MARMKNWLLGVVAFLVLVSAVPMAHAQVIVIGPHRRHYRHYDHRRYYRHHGYYHHRHGYYR